MAYKRGKVALIATQIMGFRKSKDPDAIKYGHWMDGNSNLHNDWNPFKYGMFCDDAWGKIGKKYYVSLKHHHLTDTGYKGNGNTRHNGYAKIVHDYYEANIFAEDGLVFTVTDRSEVKAKAECMAKLAKHLQPTIKGN